MFRQIHVVDHAGRATSGPGSRAARTHPDVLSGPSQKARLMSCTTRKPKWQPTRATPIQVSFATPETWCCAWGPKPPWTSVGTPSPQNLESTSTSCAPVSKIGKKTLAHPAQVGRPPRAGGTRAHLTLRPHLVAEGDTSEARLESICRNCLVRLFEAIAVHSTWPTLHCTSTGRCRSYAFAALGAVALGWACW